MNTKFLSRVATSGIIAAGTALGITAFDAFIPVNLLNVALGQPHSNQVLAQDVEENTNVRVYETASPAVVSVNAADGSGSGSIISPNGLILTNAHVVARSRTVTVRLTDGREVQGDVVAFGEPGLDLAAVQLRGQSNLPHLRLASPGSVRVGQRAFAIGNPFGQFQNTFTIGIVSRIDPERGIQTDAAINPGNSGGPLLNSQGELIGVNTSIFTTSSTAGNIGIGFAIPVDRIQPFLTAVQEGRASTVAQTDRPQINRPPEAIAVNGPVVRGNLGSGSNVLPVDNSYFNLYTFEGRAGQQIEITMSSNQLDAYLILLAPDGSDLIQDDDSGGSTNAQLVTTLPTNGTYTILANSYAAGESGDYELRVASAGSSPQPPAGQPPAQGQQPRQQPTPSGVILQEQGVLSPGGPTLSDGSLYREHIFRATQGQTVTLTMESAEFDTYLILVNEQGEPLEQNDDRCQQQTPECRNSEIRITLPQTGTYRAIANAFDASGQGRYTLTVR
ncbi:MAG: trypsin-like serine protease [Leptolyngbyaceae cyanobacterium RM2_2_4]|nr:trypsin-like serine protease [Leptolyngbyaceae cyanobacterium SM1_4_3]NJN90986.1 trypsin-like serine protease [Leptolyngbyaceae cyanobacterium SL_5_14]NJO51506.1 trypsin-like serine protease [Leptolyngbyaceae cyanobacterium RM2_2_4]